MKIIALVATDESMGIGKDGSIPWKCLQDLKRVKQLRQGQHIVMGRKTWEGFPYKFQGQLLRECHVHVMSRKQDFATPRHIHFWLHESKEHFFATMKQKRIDVDRIFIFGGAEIYRLFWDDITHIYISTIEGRYDCDTSFPRFFEEKADRVIECTYDFNVTVHDDDVWMRESEAFFPKKSEKGVNHLFAVWRRR
jgi:dihydrofolate reductase